MERAVFLNPYFFPFFWEGTIEYIQKITQTVNVQFSKLSPIEKPVVLTWAVITKYLREVA